MGSTGDSYFESGCHLLNHAMICSDPMKVAPSKNIPHSSVHCRHQRIKKDANNNPPRVRKLTRAMWRRATPLTSSLEVIKCNFWRSSAISHANRAKIAPLNIQPMGKLNHNPRMADNTERNKPSGENHFQPCQRETSHSAPKAIIQRGIVSSPMLA